MYQARTLVQAWLAGFVGTSPQGSAQVDPPPLSKALQPQSDGKNWVNSGSLVWPYMRGIIQMWEYKCVSKQMVQLAFAIRAVAEGCAGSWHT